MAAAGQATPIDGTHARLLLARAALALGDAETARGYLRDAEQVIDSIQDVGVMREEHAELAARLDALEPGLVIGSGAWQLDRRIYSPETEETTPTRTAIRRLPSVSWK
jgi:hypothetical protein